MGVCGFKPVVTSCISHLMMHTGNKNPVGDGGKEHPSGHFSLKLVFYSTCTECWSETFPTHPTLSPLCLLLAKTCCWWRNKLCGIISPLGIAVL